MQNLITARILLTTAIVATLALPGHTLVNAQAPAAQSRPEPNERSGTSTA